MILELEKHKISVVGLGYVGLPLAIELGKKYETVGFDINPDRVNQLILGFDSTNELSENEIKSSKKISFSNKIEDISTSTIYIVSVPTPIDVDNKPDLSPLLSATTMISKFIDKGNIVIFESTVYPGCTEEECVPIIEKGSNLKYNIDFFCGYSPERINPGDKKNTITNIKKVTSGSNVETSDLVDKLYSSIIKAGTHKASSIRVAEAAKAIENAQRDINIAFINELSMICDKLKISVYDVLEAAESKWNFLSFKPGLVGGHCIGVDPYYLAHKAMEVGHNPKIILSGREINDSMAEFIADKFDRAMTSKGKVLLLGITFKENCSDIRNSGVVKLHESLTNLGYDVTVLDPHADKEQVRKFYKLDIVNRASQINTKNFEGLILAVSHEEFKNQNWEDFILPQSVILDLKNFLDIENKITL